jgi:hypothetical protein
MGLTYVDARNLVELRRDQFGGTAITLGRLNVFLHRGDLRVLRGLLAGDQAAQAWFAAYKWGDYADDFFRTVLKFDAVESIDFSDTEGATIIHDLSQNLPSKLKGRFDLAVDGGTLEHIFNYPAAVANLMRLVKVGGIAYTNGPCNNLCGHGFYQFSPDLMYRVFSIANGFEILFVRLEKTRYEPVVLTTWHPVYEVKDPREAGTRVKLVTAVPVQIQAMARRINDCEPFETPMIQSDYAPDFEVREGGQSAMFRKIKSVIYHTLPHSAISRHVFGLYRRHKASLRNRRLYGRVW